MRRLASLVAALAGAGCGGGSTTTPPPPAALTALYGEVHVHQFPGGVHPAALFLAQAVPVAQVTADSVLPLAALPSRQVGACTLTLPSTCPPPCGQTPTLVDGGLVHVRGGHADADVALGFDAAFENYNPVPPLARGATIFAGGELLTISADGAAAPAFTGQVRAPAPIALLAPSAPLTASGGITVAWAPDQSDRIAISLVASTSDGRFAVLQCAVPDAPGTFTLPPELLAALPAPPRDLQLDLSRDFLAHAPSVQSGEGVVLHAGFAVTLTGHED